MTVPIEVKIFSDTSDQALEKKLAEFFGTVDEINQAISQVAAHELLSGPKNILRRTVEVQYSVIPNGRWVMIGDTHLQVPLFSALVLVRQES